MVRTERLIEDLWADEAVGTARNVLQTKVSRLRRALGDAALVTGTSAGYTLEVDPSAVDALEVLRLAEQASAFRGAGDPSAALETCTTALAMFGGEILSAAGDGDWVMPYRARLEEVRLGLVEDQLAARLDLGAAGEVIGELEALVQRASAARGPVGVADGRPVPRRPPSRCAGDVPAGQELVGRRARPRPWTATAAARAPDPGPRPVTRRPLFHGTRARAGQAGRKPAVDVCRARRSRDRSGGGRRSARRRAARRDRRAGRRRQDGGRDRDRPQAELVGRCRARWRLVGQTRNRGDARRRRRHVGRRVERGRRGGAVRAPQEQHRIGHPRQLRTRHRRGRGARRSPPRRRPRGADPVHQPGSTRRRR